MKDRILIFIPMYNCEKQIPRVLERISQVENYKDIFEEIIVVDNQSKDNSIAVAKATIEKLNLPARVLRNRENRSLGGSHKTAFLYAIEHGFDYVVVLHGDDQGDIHDIGKNIVKLLLENYGFDVRDLGKDVPPETIVDKVIELQAPLVGLSALMTTTVPAMEETIKQLREKAPWCKVVVGGAVLTQEYADKIGADKYAKDAMETVRYAEEIL